MRCFLLNDISEKEFGYIYGFYCGDGYAYHDKKSRHRYVEFFVDSKDTDILTNVKGILERKGHTVFLHKDSRFNCIRIRVNSTGFFNEINEIEKRFPTSPSFRKGFIEGMIDSDGYVNPKNSFIEIVNTNRELMKMIIVSLEVIGLSTKIRDRIASRKDKKKSYRIYVPMKFKCFNTLSMKIKRTNTAE